ncbi:DUF488 family protein [Chitinophaga sp. RCC_12]|uniref:DUF488 domain-containing protein n=1 Tax=Chitinophaga sp. RCC_12 TaxID=3239226 RepID=UPI0035241C82
MFYRRKVILSLLQIFEDQLDKISLQKLSFLLCQRQKEPEYDFVPYKFGCFSFSLTADLTAMVSKNILSETESHFIKKDKQEYFKTLKEEDKKIVLDIKRLYGEMNSNALMKHTYINYPYWAINSVKAKSILSPEELVNIELSRSISLIEPGLFTIGYEGISLEAYLNRLIKNNIHILIDVRNNPLSMKFGFSKNMLRKYCASLGIEYLHYPEVGIQSDQRQQLNSQSDYDNLFSAYCKVNLTKTKPTQSKIFDHIKQGKRIALTCFEANICQCHRKHLAEAIGRLPGFIYEIKHI